MTYIVHVLVLLVDNPFKWFNERQAGHTLMIFLIIGILWSLIIS